MPKSRIGILSLRLRGYFVLSALLLGWQPAFGVGVTIITHGLNGNTDGWITSMADRIPDYYHFPGTNFTCYEMYFFQSGSNYFLTSVRVSGSEPFAPDSGEIIIKLDWRQLANGNSYDTYEIASAVVPALLSTNFISELNGHALAELPMHLIGHSRGGSLACEISRQLGTNGVWVDHLTTLDPHPLNNDGFIFDAFLYSDVDAPAHTYSNVLFHDNYWQTVSSPINGESVNGAYKRQLTSFSGGYSGTGSEHSDVHLWYHGTIDTNTPTSYVEDGQTISITASMRTNWWNSSESRGLIAGFYYSLIGGGNRLSPGPPAIVTGFNQAWDLGAGNSANRTALPANNGNWPNLIRLNRVGTNNVVQGQSAPVAFYYQWAQPTNNSGTISFFIDDDLNPFSGNEKLLRQIVITATTATNVYYQSVPLTFDATNALPGLHALFARISGGGRTRYLYAPELIQILPGVSTEPPILVITQPQVGAVAVTWPPDHTGWRLQAQTNSIAIGLNSGWVDVLGSTNVNSVTNPLNSVEGSVFYRLTYP